MRRTALAGVRLSESDTWTEYEHIPTSRGTVRGMH
jgi:hypothetical protein